MSEGQGLRERLAELDQAVADHLLRHQVLSRELEGIAAEADRVNLLVHENAQARQAVEAERREILARLER